MNVTVNDSTTYNGTVLGVDATRDLAVVSICCGDFTALEFGDAAALEVGDEVVNIGYALGSRIEGFRRRLLRASYRPYAGTADHGAYVIQSDAAINPGQQWGPHAFAWKAESVGNQHLCARIGLWRGGDSGLQYRRGR